MNRMHSHIAYALIWTVGCLLGLSTVVLAQVAESDLQDRDGLLYLEGSDTPYSGRVAGGDGPTGKVDAGKRTGEWVWYYDDGQKEYAMVYEDGTRVKGTGWHPNGQIETEMSFKEGRPHGARRSWDRHGHLRQERFYENGKLEGEETIRDHNGNLLYSANYTDGKLDGDVVWWYPDGTPRWSTHYAAGARTGTWSQNAPDGDLLMETTWDNDHLVSRNNPHEGH